MFVRMQIIQSRDMALLEFNLYIHTVSYWYAIVVIDAHLRSWVLHHSIWSTLESAQTISLPKIMWFDMHRIVKGVHESLGEPPTPTHTHSLIHSHTLCCSYCNWFFTYTFLFLCLSIGLVPLPQPLGARIPIFSISFPNAWCLTRRNAWPLRKP